MKGNYKTKIMDVKLSTLDEGLQIVLSPDYLGSITTANPFKG